MRFVFELVKASKFFERYAKGVNNYKHKLRGIDGNGKEIWFSVEDKKLIVKGLKEMFKDIFKNAK